MFIKYFHTHSNGRDIFIFTTFLSNLLVNIIPFITSAWAKSFGNRKITNNIVITWKFGFTIILV